MVKAWNKPVFMFLSFLETNSHGLSFGDGLKKQIMAENKDQRDGRTERKQTVNLYKLKTKRDQRDGISKGNRFSFFSSSVF